MQHVSPFSLWYPYSCKGDEEGNMSALKCLCCLKRLRLPCQSITSSDCQLLLWKLEHSSCCRHEATGHLHSTAAMLDKTLSACTNGAVRNISNGLLNFRLRPGAQHMMKRAMGTTSSGTPPDLPDERGVHSGCRSKFVKTHVEQKKKSVHVVCRTGADEEKVCVEELKQRSCTDVSSHLTRMLGAGESSSSQSYATEPLGAEAVSNSDWGHVYTGSPSHTRTALTSKLVAYPLAHLRKYTNPATMYESFRYYHPTVQTNASSPQVQNRCHIIFDDEEHKVAREGSEEAENQRNPSDTRSASVESPIYVTSSPDSPTSVSSSGISPDLKISKIMEQGQYQEEGEASSSSGEAAAGETLSEADYKERLLHELRKLPRQWEYTPFGLRHHSRTATAQGTEKKTSRSVEFSVMTYNILAQDLLENHPYLYSDSKPDSLDWNGRRQRLLAEIEFHSPDVINMQEVQRDHFRDHLYPKLKEMGYRGVYQKRSNSSDGCATMWKQDKFQLLRTTPVNYQRGGVLDRDNIALIVELLPVQPKKRSENQEEDKLVIANTHLLFNPKRGDVKLAQLIVLLAEIDKCAFVAPSTSTSKSDFKIQTPSQHSQLHPNPWGGGKTAGTYSPVIMTGDFNLEPYSELYNFIIKGHLDYDGLLVRAMSGQEEGQYGPDRSLDRHFFSPTFGITERCQYHGVVNSRLQRTHNMRTSKRMSLESKRRQPVDFTEDCLELGEEEEEWECFPVAPLRVNTGSLWHHLNLVSAYRHRIERFDRRKPEVTTHHSRAACTVDYIFYTVHSKEVNMHKDEIRLRNIQDDRLRLIARYGLMSAEEIAKMDGIPNHTLASDHMCLIAKFLLK